LPPAFPAAVNRDGGPYAVGDSYGKNSRVLPTVPMAQHMMSRETPWRRFSPINKEACTVLRAIGLRGTPRTKAPFSRNRAKGGSFFKEQSEGAPRG
jgi:hypothetical protein